MGMMMLFWHGVIAASSKRMTAKKTTCSKENAAQYPMKLYSFKHILRTTGDVYTTTGDKG